MYSKNKRPSPSTVRGFTLIEVLIVLAVAGFILTVILIALPALQRNSRNYQRKHAAELLASGLEQYRTNYGSYPATDTEFDLLIENMPEITKGPIRIEYRDTSWSHSYWPEEDYVAIQYGHWCNNQGNGDNATDPIAGDHANISFYAVWTQLEPDGTDPEDRNTFCVDNYYQ